MYKIYEGTKDPISTFFQLNSHIALLSIAVFRIHFNGDFVAEGGREFLNAALEMFVRLWIRCIVTGHYCVFGNSLHGRLIFLKRENVCMYTIAIF